MADDLWNRVDPAEREVVQRYMAAYPVKVGELANELGLVVLRSVLEPKISGLIQPSSNARSGYEIRVNKYEVRERQRFTVAHEIAHYLLHRRDIGHGVVDSVMYRSNLTSKKESEANKLAAAMVMPYEAVRRELSALTYSDLTDTVDTLASKFGVSAPAMRVRLGIA